MPSKRSIPEIFALSKSFDEIPPKQPLNYLWPTVSRAYEYRKVVSMTSTHMAHEHDQQAITARPLLLCTSHSAPNCTGSPPSFEVLLPSHLCEGCRHIVVATEELSLPPLVTMPGLSAHVASSELEEEIHDFGRRFARFIISRGFADAGGAGIVDPSTTSRAGERGRVVSTDFSSMNVRSSLETSAADAEMELKASQRMAQQLQADSDAVRFRVLPSLRENARQLQSLFVAIDRLSDEVMPEIEESVSRMEKAMYQMEERRKEQVETRSLHGSYGLGSPWGAGLWVPPSGDRTVHLPDAYETNEVFCVEKGGLAPL